MRNILFISYFFPPAGGPGVQRVAKHVKFLREFGYNPIVVTATPDDYRGHSMWEMPLDESLATDVPAETEIHRVASRQPFRLFAWLAKWRLDFLRELFFVPDTAVTWMLPAVKRARQIAQERPIDLIYTSVRPHSVALIGWALKRLLGQPWVLDFRDPWTQYFLATFPSKLHYRFEQWLERFLLRRADHVVTITPSARANLLAWCDFLSEEKVSCITNGYDEGDFDASRESDEKNGVFQLVYAGVFCGAAANGNSSGKTIEKAWRGWRRRLAYAPRCFDRLTHSPKFLLDAMCELFAERPDLRGRLKLVHVGPFDEANERYVRELGLGGAVEARGYVRHAEAVRLLKQADALFFCLADSPTGERNDCVPQKLYEYLGSRRPVLALAPAGDARDFLVQAQTAVICPPRDVRAIKEAMLSLMAGAPQFAPNEEFIQSFKRRALTAQLAEIFDRVTAN